MYEGLIGGRGQNLDTIKGWALNDIMIKRVHHAAVIIPRGKEDVARSFYCGILGLQEVEKPIEVRANGGFWLQLGNFQIHLSIQDGYDPSKTKAHLAYEVENLQAITELLKSRGFEVTPDKSFLGLVRANVRDPFGNRIELLQQAE